LTSHPSALRSALHTLIDRLETDLVAIDKGDIRYGIRKRAGPWTDTTEETIHDKRNMIATLNALLKLDL
jgi:hypothetical protein